jgi:hypothetical protein
MVELLFFVLQRIHGPAETVSTLRLLKSLVSTSISLETLVLKPCIAVSFFISLQNTANRRMTDSRLA